LEVAGGEVGSIGRLAAARRAARLCEPPLNELRHSTWENEFMSAASPATTPPAKREVKIISHSMLFYWWPVWAVGFLMAFLTYLDGHRLAIVPAKTEAVESVDVPGYGPRAVLIAPAEEKLPEDPETHKPKQPTLHVASHSGYGVIAAVVLLLVIFITNVPIRGPMALIVIITVFLLSIILALTRTWDDIFDFFDHSHIYINAFGYLALAVPLFIIWLVALLIFDKRSYMIFAPGQLRVCTAIGAGEVAYDTMGMIVEKKRSDLFRHWLLGFGSGDLYVKTSGANSQHFEMPNVLFIGGKLQLIQQMLQTREIVAGS
jgi:hypothetical protein